ncbi:recombinase family protein [Ensifer sp. 4252]|uniref:recombinase family protein n=1 Tax=Ensifer sp. 4252 TaxID=3373915 RepID=UPI003D1F2C7A
MVEVRSCIACVSFGAVCDLRRGLSGRLGSKGQIGTACRAAAHVGPPGELIFHVFGAIAHFERRLISERTKDGIAAARAKGNSPAATARYEEGRCGDETCRRWNVAG